MEYEKTEYISSQQYYNKCKILNWSNKNVCTSLVSGRNAYYYSGYILNLKEKNKIFFYKLYKYMHLFTIFHVAFEKLRYQLFNLFRAHSTLKIN